MEDLAVPAGGFRLGEERLAQAIDDLLDEQWLRSVEQEKRRDTPGRGVAQDSSDLQLRILRRRS
jgi:hypothetical protein